MVEEKRDLARLTQTLWMEGQAVKSHVLTIHKMSGVVPHLRLVQDRMHELGPTVIGAEYILQISDQLHTGPLGII